MLNAAPGCLQVYDFDSQNIEFIDCEKRNAISRANEDFPYPLEITQVAFVDDFMATLQISNSHYMKISQLKF